MSRQEASLKKEIIKIGRQLYERRLVVATSGNLSARLGNDEMLVTATGTALGSLRPSNILKVSLHDTREKNKRLSIEFPLHSLIYKNLYCQAVIHCHPPLINGYFAVYDELKTLTFESRLYLGAVPVVTQETPSITQPEAVVDALKVNNLVVVKNHGLVCIGASFSESFNLIETLEEAVKVAAVARLFKRESFDRLDRELKDSLLPIKGQYRLFSLESMLRILELANQDPLIAQKGLTLQLALVLDGENGTKAFKFHFKKGKITKMEYRQDAPFVFSARRAVWELVFLGKLDPFVAITQGKMKFKGDFSKLSPCYVPVARFFSLFKRVKLTG